MLMRDIRDLHHNPQNARNHPAKQIRQLANSLTQTGVFVPPVIDENNLVLSGHARLLAAKLLKLKTIPVLVVTGLNEAQKRAYALADNKIAANAGWDRTILAAELGELGDLLPQFNLSLEVTGFETGEIDCLFGDLSDPEHDPADDIPTPETARGRDARAEATAERESGGASLRVFPHPAARFARVHPPLTGRESALVARLERLFGLSPCCTFQS